SHPGEAGRNIGRTRTPPDAARVDSEWNRRALWLRSQPLRRETRGFGAALPDTGGNRWHQRGRIPYRGRSTQAIALIRHRRVQAAHPPSPGDGYGEIARHTAKDCAVRGSGARNAGERSVER